MIRNNPVIRPWKEKSSEEGFCKDFILDIEDLNEVCIEHYCGAS